MNDGDFIKIYRSLLDWEWWHDKNTCRVFLYMLLKANWKEGNFQGATVPRGSFVSSIHKLAEKTNLSEREVRTAIKHLKLTGEVTSKATSKFTVFTITKYNAYQTNDTQSDKEVTSKRHSKDNQVTTIEEKKEKKEGKNNNTMCKKEAFALFEQLWRIYPVKKGKGQVSDTTKNKLLKIGLEEMQRAIERYQTELKKDSWRKPQNGSTFFNSGYVDYLDAEWYKTHPPEKNTESQKQEDIQSPVLQEEPPSNEEDVDWGTLNDEEWLAYMERLSAAGKI